MPKGYAWKITTDHLFLSGDSETDECAKGPIVGPRGAPSDPALAGFEWEEEFRMYDDDDVLCYSGVLYSDKSKNDLAGIANGFEPLDDFGTPNAGCTRIDYKNARNGRWETL